MKSKCCNSDVFIKVKNGQNLIYCKSCGQYIKNANKDDLRSIEMSESSSIKQTSDMSDSLIIAELKAFISSIEYTIKVEDDVIARSNIDMVRKTSKIFELERVRRSLINITEGKKYND